MSQERWQRSDGASLLAAFVIFTVWGLTLFIGFSTQGKNIDRNYQQIFTETGSRTPRSLEEAARWMIRAERPAFTGNNVLGDYQDGEPLPNTYSQFYGWKVVTHSVCNTKTASIKVEFVVDNQVREVLDIPLAKDDRGLWFGSAETTSVRFEAHCFTYDNSVYFRTEMFLK